MISRRPNPAFFAHLEQRIADLRALNIEADLILFHPYDRWGYATMSRRRTIVICVTCWRGISAYREHLVVARQ